MKMKIRAGFKGKKIIIDVDKLNKLGGFRGLMFRSKDCENLLFDKKGRWAIHSFFVFFPFLALWLDKRNNIIEWKIVKPFCFGVAPEKSFEKMVEMPFNDKNKKIINFVVGKKGLNRH